MQATNIIIRPFRKADLESLATLTTELGYATTVGQMTARMNDISQLENYWTYIALKNENVVGYMGLNKNYLWEQDGFFLRIQAFVVKKEFRRAGVGQQLIATAEKLASEINAKAIVLNCGSRPERATAHSFYTKSGFIPKSIGYIKLVRNP